ncbi:L-lactate dehydrogenase [Spiroplasma endosymbiont of Othius punctulatus]|uniref:L-lactate dehydrogenase n=1 Tax=Spiroplasma endosymbiont of Othius punctulatus TaxID=3066289 RepID=UPI0030D3456A
MNRKGHKVVLVGCGAVGTSFMYASINQAIASEYVLIDVFKDAADGNQLDLADTLAVLPNSFSSIKSGDYSDCKDADVVVITAGRPQKPGETRLDMVADNAKIMKGIALEIKKSGFKGVTVIASNPVDVLTKVYEEITKFDPKSIIGSGTTLDSARLRRLLAEKLNVHPASVNAYLMGEHGDSSVACWSQATVMGKPIAEYIAEGKVNQKELDQIREDAVHMAYKIIEKKRATFYGIGVCLARIVQAVLNNERASLMIGALLNGEYGNKGLYTGVPAIVGANGWESIIEWKLSDLEKTQFDDSFVKLAEVYKAAEKAIK